MRAYRNTHRRLAELLLLLVMSVASGQRLEAQLGTATLGGTVRDPSGSVVSGVHITLASETEKASRTTVTNSAGEYVIPAIPPGTYRLDVTANGFQPQALTGVVLTSGQGSTLDVALALGKAVQQVTVTEAPALLDTTTATVGAEVTQREFASLPMVGRSFTALIKTLPGVANIPNADNAGSSGVDNTSFLPSVYGQRQRDNSYTVDGAVALEPNFTRLGMIPPPEAIAEMKVSTATDSGAYGWASGANINLVTESGSDRYHGDVWEYLRNGDLDSRSFFTPNVGKYQWNQFGFSGGGPLQIPHLVSPAKAWYVFGWYEGVRINQAANVASLVPTAAQLQGNFAGSPTIYNPYTTVVGPTGNIVSRTAFTANQIPSGATGLLNPTAVALATALYPAPNLATGVIPGKNFLSTVPGTNNSDQWSTRVDHQFGANDSFYARYSDWRYNISSTTLPAIPSLEHQRWTNIVANDTHTFSPTTLLTVRFATQRTLDNQFSGGPDVMQSTGLVSTYPAYHGYDSLPSLTIPGYPTLNQFYGNQGPEYYSSWTADAQKITGRHTFAFGGGFLRDTYFADHSAGGEDFGTAQTAFGTGTGYGLASFLLGLPLDANRQAGNTGGHFLFNLYSLYFQDTFRITSKLTLNAGLRWDYLTPPSTNPGIGGFDWNTGNYYWTATNPITSAAANHAANIVPPDYNGWQPRLGLAYAVTPKTVVRSSFGIFDDIFGGNQQSYTGTRGNWPYAFAQSISGLNVTTPSAFLQNPFPGQPVGTSTPVCCGQEANYNVGSTRQPYVEEWTFSVQHQLTPSTKIEAAYFGAHGVKLSSQIIDNVGYPDSPTGSFTTRQRWPSEPVYIMNNYNEFMSWYDGLEVKAEKRFSQGLSLLFSYTWSKTLDQSDSLGSGNIYGVQNYNPTRFDFSQFKAPAIFDLGNIVSASYIYDIPLKTGDRWADGALAHWQLSGITSYSSGIPYVVLLSTDNENRGVVTGRISEFPNLACNPSGSYQPTLSEWFNTSCYQLPAFGAAGNAGRHTLFGDPLGNWDLALEKRWPFGREKERRNVELRGEFFNALNSHSFSPPGSTFGSSSLGTVSAVRQPGRIIQVALKIHF